MNTLKRTIHLHVGQALFESTEGIVRLEPRLLDGRSLPVKFSLLQSNAAVIQEWDLPDTSPVVLNSQGGRIALYDPSGRAIPGIHAHHFFPPNGWYILRYYVIDPDDGSWHASYSALTSGLEGFAAFNAHRKMRLTLHATPTPVCPSGAKNIRIVARNIVVGDAVSNFAMGMAGTLEKAGMGVRLYAHDTSPAYAGIVAPVSLLYEEIKKDDIVFYNYSIGDDFFPDISELPCSKRVLYYHNATPGLWFRPYDTTFADRLDSVQAQFPLFGRFDAIMANSSFSLDALSPHIHPATPTMIHAPFFGLTRLTESENLPLPKARHRLLCVGRIAPHKRPDLVLEIFNALICQGLDASLTFVGGGYHDFYEFAAHMDTRLNGLPKKIKANIQFLENLSEGQLAFLYRNASLLLCTSAHEGYCMPLAEAAAFDLPVAAMPQPAVLETLNGGGIILNEDPVAAAVQIKDFLTTADEAERRRAVPVLKPLPTEELIHLIAGDT